MSGFGGGVAVLAAIAALLAAPVVLARHRRQPQEVVTTGSAHGRAGMAIHPWRGHRLTLALAWVLALGVIALGLSYLRSSLPAAAFFLAVGLFFAYLGWCRATGRAGDGTLTLTPEGIHQLWAGSEVFVPWDDVRGLVTSRADFIVETTRPVVPVHHLPPFLSPRRVVTEGAVSLPRRNLPPLPFQEMVELYATSPVARDGLATDDVVRRARDILAEALRTPTPQRRVTAPPVRVLVEFVLQVISWVALAVAGGSLYLIATTGSAPVIDSAPVALVVALASAAVIWVTRRSLYKKQYRGY